jgi:hypothetical protein
MHKAGRELFGAVTLGSALAEEQDFFDALIAKTTRRA